MKATVGHQYYWHGRNLYTGSTLLTAAIHKPGPQTSSEQVYSDQKQQLSTKKINKFGIKETSIYKYSKNKFHTSPTRSNSFQELQE